MKYLLIFFLGIWSFVNAQTCTANPSTINASQPVTFTFNVTGNTALQNLTSAWVWAWVPGEGDAPSNINPATSNPTATAPAQLTNVSGNTWQITFTPTTFFNMPASEINQIGILMKGDNWSNGQTSDFTFNVGSFQLNLQAPQEDSVTYLNSGESLNIVATTSATATITLKANGNTVISNTSTFLGNTYTVTQDTQFEITAVRNGETKNALFQAKLSPIPTEQALPAGLEHGINFNPSDPTKATLVLYAPEKDFGY